MLMNFLILPIDTFLVIHHMSYVVVLASSPLTCSNPRDRPTHRIFMTFFLRAGRQVSFLEADLKTPLFRTFTFADPEKIRELGRRGEPWGTLEDKQALEDAIEMGRGGMFLNLTADQIQEASDP
jgi:hypothetical protein